MKRVWFAILLIAFIVVASWGDITPIAVATLFSMATTTATPTPAPTGIVLPTPMPTPAALQPRAIDIMLLGSDRRPPREDWRTDVMILVSIDPQEKLVSMVSIPRDLYVFIPGYGKTRLNMADNIGEAQGYRDGGPGLLRALLYENLGITFDHYVRIDFQGFTEIIDILGGVDVDVRCPTELWVPNMKSPGEYKLFRTVPAGMQHMDGEFALIYCRCRAHTPVFDRDRRQREMLLAIRNRVMELGVSGLLPRLFELVENMQNNIQTDLEPAEILALAQLLSQIPPHNISQGLVDLTLAPRWTTSDGAWVMLPDRRRIKESMEGRMAPPTWEETSLAEEEVRIAVDNGTPIEGFSSQVADRLRYRGYWVVEVGKADRLDHTKTMIISHSGPSFTLDCLRRYFHIGEEEIQNEPDWLSRVDIRVILGSDAQPACQ